MMKNKLFIVLMTTLLIGTMLTGCGEEKSPNIDKNVNTQQLDTQNSEEEESKPEENTETEKNTETEGNTDSEESVDKEEQKTVTFTDILLNPSQNTKYYPKSADYNDIWFAVADVDGDSEGELFIGDRYDEGMQQVDRIYNILALNNGTIKDLTGNMVYGRTYMFTLFDNGYLFEGMDDGSQLGLYVNLRTGELFEGEIPDDVYTMIWSGKEIPLVWYRATEENVNAILGGK